MRHLLIFLRVRPLKILVAAARPHIGVGLNQLEAERVQIKAAGICWFEPVAAAVSTPVTGSARCNIVAGVVSEFVDAPGLKVRYGGKLGVAQIRLALLAGESIYHVFVPRLKRHRTSSLGLAVVMQSRHRFSDAEIVVGGECGSSTEQQS